jgi:hypothetical protein
MGWLGFRYRFGWNPSPKLHFAIAVSMTVIAAAMGVYFYLAAERQLDRSELLTGIVIESRVSSDGMHSPIISYEDAQGEKQSFVSKLSSSPQRYFEGDSVEVLIRPDTQQPMLKNFITVYALPLFLGVFSTICCLGSFVIYVTRVK